jgi:hypothetical protein
MRLLARSAAGRRGSGVLVLALCAVLVAIGPGRSPQRPPAVHPAHGVESGLSASHDGAVERALLADRPQLRTADGTHRPYLVAALLLLALASLTSRWPRATTTPSWLPRSTWSKAGSRERAPPPGLDLIT